MKKSCLGCRALFTNTGPGSKCELGYPLIENQTEIRGGGTMYIPVPQCQCPKPRSNQQMIDSVRYHG